MRRKRNCEEGKIKKMGVRMGGNEKGKWEGGGEWKGGIEKGK